MNQSNNRQLFDGNSISTPLKESVNNAVEIIKAAYENGKKLLLCGNGGSAADCEHIVGELMKEFCIDREIPDSVKDSLRKSGADERMIENIIVALPAISLTSNISFLTAYNNDNDPRYVFAQQLYALGEKEDVLLAISTSGNSENVVNAAIMARARDIKVVSLTGRSGGKLKELSDCQIAVQSDNTARIQELHVEVYHYICEKLEQHFFKEKKSKK